jgi:hypothetical protein
LRWRSQELNVKLFTIADKLITELPGILNTRPTEATPVDHYLMSLTFEETA